LIPNAINRKSCAMSRLTALATLCAAAALLTAAPAAAQFGTLFGDPPPRPPAGLRGQPVPPPPEDDEEDVPELPQGRVLPAAPGRQPGQSNLAAPPPGSYQSQPLPPPPATTVVPQNPSPPPAASVSPPPPAPNPPAPPAKGTASRNAPPAPPTLQPGDEVVSDPPTQKIVNKKAVFAGLDKITGRITSFDVDINETVQFGALRVKTNACYTRPATESANTDAFVEVDEITLQGEVKRIFSGWMFAASPGLHGVEHPIYDIWLTGCKAPETTVAAQQPENKPAAQPAPPPQKRQPSRQQRAQPAAPPPPPAQPQAQPLLPSFAR
jgi:hypothetical protein